MSLKGNTAWAGRVCLGTWLDEILDSLVECAAPLGIRLAHFRHFAVVADSNGLNCALAPHSIASITGNCNSISKEQFHEKMDRNPRVRRGAAAGGR
jgi:hypothetical protein